MLLARWIAAGIWAVTLAASVTVRAYKVDPNSNSLTIVSLADFDTCAADYAGGDLCLAGLRAYVDKQPKEAFAAGKRARLHYQHWAALSFFAKAFAKAAPAAQCGDADVAMALVSGLSFPSQHENVATARDVAARCWEHVQPKLVAALQGDTSYYRTNACVLFAEKNVAAAECAPPKPEAKKAQSPTASELLKGVDYKTLTTDLTTVRVYRSQRGEELLTVRTKGPREYVLLKFKGIAGPWAGRVWVAVEEPGGRGKNFVVIADQREWIAVTERDGYYQAYPKGVPDPISLYEIVLDRGLKDRPTAAEVIAEFAGKAPAAKK